MPGLDDEEERQDQSILPAFEARQARQGRVPREALPAGALEDFLAQRITAATADGSLAAHVDASLGARIAGKREAIEKIRADLPGRVASASVAASKYTEDLGKFEGRARELVEAKLRAETNRLVAAERQLAETERDRLDLEVADREAEWIGAALRDFARVWKLMTPRTRGAAARARRRGPREGGDPRRRGRAGELRRRRRLEGGRMTLDQQPTAPTEDAPKVRHILTGTLFRRRSSRATLGETPPPLKPAPVRRPAMVARILALAHHLQSAIDRGLVADRAAVARKLGLTRAQVTQLLDLLLLAPDLAGACTDARGDRRS